MLYNVMLPDRTYNAILLVYYRSGLHPFKFWSSVRYPDEKITPYYVNILILVFSCHLNSEPLDDCTCSNYWKRGPVWVINYHQSRVLFSLQQHTPLLKRLEVRTPDECYLITKHFDVRNLSHFGGHHWQSWQNKNKIAIFVGSWSIVQLEGLVLVLWQ